MNRWKISMNWHESEKLWGAMALEDPTFYGSLPPQTLPGSEDKDLRNILLYLWWGEQNWNFNHCEM